MVQLLLVKLINCKVKTGDATLKTVLFVGKSNGLNLQGEKKQWVALWPEFPQRHLFLP
jgi:hypothetical protein